MSSASLLTVLQAALVQKAVAAQRALLVTAVQAKKPTQDQGLKLFEPTTKIITEIVEIKDKAPRSGPQFNHLSTISEGIPALGWVLVSPTPGPFVADARQASEFYSNRILKEFKGKDQQHVDWVAGFHGFLTALQAYVKKNHTTELSWKGQGDAIAIASSAGGAAPPAPKGPPAPPAGAPPPPGPAPAAATSHKTADPSKMFAELNKGEAVTSGLRKVKAEEKTKNRKPEERSSVVKAKEEDPTKESKHADDKIAKKAGPPKFALEGNKWVVENQVGNKSIVISETEPRHTVYIYKCTNSVVVVKGKINTITVDACSKLGLVFDNAIASVEVVNSKSVEVQVTGKVPSFAVDKTSAFNLYLSKDCLDAEIITSKSDAMNVVLPPQKEGDDLIELPIPEQFKTTVKAGKLVTEAVRHE